MKCYLYILQSCKDGSYYVGISGDFKKRLEEHNSGKSKSTKAKRPWAIKRIEEYPDRSKASIREKQIKRFKSKKIIEKIISVK